MHHKSHCHLILFSACKSDTDSLTNLRNTSALAESLSAADIRFLTCDGVYHGEHEAAFCAFLPSNPSTFDFQDKLNVIRDACKRYRQESYLEVSPEQTARLVYLADDRLEPLGQASFTPEKPESGDYTYFPPDTYLIVGA